MTTMIIMIMPLSISKGNNLYSKFREFNFPETDYRTIALD